MVSGVKSLAYQSPLHIDETNQNRVDIACATSFLEFIKCHDSLFALSGRFYFSQASVLVTQCHGIIRKRLGRYPAPDGADDRGESEA